MQNGDLGTIDIEGYKLYKTMSLSQNGGVGLYIKNTRVSNPCEQLNFRCEEFETV